MWAAGLRGWRRTARVERTRPDFAFPRYRLAVFVDGCFWHGCPQCCRRPATNTSYWHSKLDRNIERDGQQTERLERVGWTVLRLWGHEVERDPGACALRVMLTLRGSPSHDGACRR